MWLLKLKHEKKRDYRNRKNFESRKENYKLVESELPSKIVE